MYKLLIPIPKQVYFTLHAIILFFPFPILMPYPTRDLTLFNFNFNSLQLTPIPLFQLLIIYSKFSNPTDSLLYSRGKFQFHIFHNSTYYSGVLFEALIQYQINDNSIHKTNIEQEENVIRRRSIWQA